MKSYKIQVRRTGESFSDRAHDDPALLSSAFEVMEATAGFQADGVWHEVGSCY